MINLIDFAQGFYQDYKKNNKKAIKHYKNSKLKTPYVNFRIGECLFRDGQFLEARSFFEKAVETDNPLVFYRLGLIYEKNGDKINSSKNFLLAISKRPGWMPWVEHFLSSKPDLEELTPEQSRLLGVKEGASWHALAEVRIKTNKHIQALPYLEKALKTDPSNAEWLYEIGFCEYKLGHYAIALTYFEKALKNKFKKPVIHYYSYLSYQKIGDLKKASESLKKLEVSGKIPVIYGSAEYDRSLGDWLHAKEELERYLDKYPSCDSQAHYLYALCNDFLLNLECAKKHLELSVALSDKVENFKLVRLGFIELQNKNYNEAVSAFKKSLSISKSSEVRYYLGYSLYKVSKYKEASDVFSKLQSGFEFAPKYLQDKILTCLYKDFDQNVAWQLGEFYRKSGEYFEACKYYLRMKQLLKIHSYKISENKFNSDENFRRNCIYLGYQNYPLQENAILYESFLANTMSCNPYALFESIYFDRRYSNFNHIWVVNDPNTIPPKWRNANRVIFIKRNSDAYLKCLATCKFLINNVTFPYWFIKRIDQVYCNTWHGTPIKALGIDNKYSGYDYGNATRNFILADILIQPNKYTENIMLNAYQIKGLGDAKSYVSGYPRVDLSKLCDEDRGKLRKDIFGDIKDKKIILFAPTWRDYEDIETQEKRTKKILETLKDIDSNKYHVVFKGHQFIEKKLAENGLLSLPRWLDTNVLLGLIDILITDYSSIGIDFLCTGKPVIYLVEDFAKYREGRGLYLEKEKFPGIICESHEMLPEVINDIYNKYNRIKIDDEFYRYDDGNCCERVKEILFNRVERDVAKNQVMIYPGSLLRNGILSAFLSLIKELSRIKRVFVLIDAKNCENKDNHEILERIKSYAQIIPRVGSTLTNIQENFVKNGWSIYNRFPNENFKKCIQDIYSREGYRLLGFNQFDAFINYEGYNLEYSSIVAFNENCAKKTIFCHNDMKSEMIEKYPYLNRMFEEYKQYDKILSVSNDTHLLNLSNISCAYDIDVHKFDYIDNIIDTERVLNLASQSIDDSHRKFFVEGKTFINLARLSMEKGHEKLIRAFSQVVEFDSQARLLLLGQGYLYFTLKHLIDDLGLSSNVFLLGYIENPYPYITNSDCFVLSSDHEGQPVVLQEAMILSKPIISTDLVSTRNLLKGSGAMLVKNSQEELAKSMIHFLKYGLNKACFNFEEYNSNAFDIFLSKAL